MCQGSQGSTRINQRQVRTMIAPEPARELCLQLKTHMATKSSHCWFPALLQFAITIKLVAFLCSSRLCNHSKKIINMRPVLHQHFSRVQLWSSLFFVGVFTGEFSTCSACSPLAVCLSRACPSVHMTCTPDRGKACLGCSFSFLLEGITRQSGGSQLDATEMAKSATSMWLKNGMPF